MIHVHLIDHRHVELVENEGLSHVTGELGMTHDVGEGGNHLERERRGVVVVDQHDDVGRFFADPLLGPLVAFKERCPIITLLFTAVKSGSNSGDVARGDPGGDTRHR